MYVFHTGRLPAVPKLIFVSYASHSIDFLLILVENGGFLPPQLVQLGLDLRVRALKRHALRLHGLQLGLRYGPLSVQPQQVGSEARVVLLRLGEVLRGGRGDEC